MCGNTSTPCPGCFRGTLTPGQTKRVYAKEDPRVLLGVVCLVCKNALRSDPNKTKLDRLRRTIISGSVETPQPQSPRPCSGCVRGTLTPGQTKRVYAEEDPRVLLGVVCLVCKNALRDDTDGTKISNLRRKLERRREHQGVSHADDDAGGALDADTAGEKEGMCYEAEAGGGGEGDARTVWACGGWYQDAEGVWHEAEAGGGGMGDARAVSCVGRWYQDAEGVWHEEEEDQMEDAQAAGPPPACAERTREEEEEETGSGQRARLTPSGDGWATARVAVPAAAEGGRTPVERRATIEETMRESLALEQLARDRREVVAQRRQGLLDATWALENTTRELRAAEASVQVGEAGLQRRLADCTRGTNM